MAQLEQLETWAGVLLEKLSPARQRSVALEIARYMRRQNIGRMLAQRGPDGGAWEGRKRPRRPGRPVRYVYQARDGHVREIEMSSYRRDAGRIIGYDKEAKGIRTMLSDGRLRKLSPKHGGGSDAARKRKAAKMMQGLARVKWLQTQGTGNSAVVQFVGHAARIAAVHHYGLKDRVRPGGAQVDYPARELLGFAPQDIDGIRDILLRYLGQ